MVRPTVRYRFRIANLCDVAQEYTATAVGQFGTTNIIIGAHSFVAGDYAYFEGFDGPINGYREIEGVDSTTVRILISGTVDTAILGTVKKINERYVLPYNFPDSQFEWNREGEEIFFRKLFDSPLKFLKADYDYFVSEILPNECCEVKFIIEKKCSGMGFLTEDDREITTEQDWNVEWRGYFTHNSCEWDLSHCNVTVKFELDDFYRCLLYGYEDKQTIFETLQYFERLECCEERSVPTLGLLECSSVCNNYITAIGESPSTPDLIQFNPNSLVNPCDGSDRGDWQVEKVVQTQLSFTNQPVEIFNVCFTWIREVAITIDSLGVATEPSGTGWVMREAVNYNGAPAHKWTRLPYGGIYYSWSDYSIDLDSGCDLPCTSTISVNFPETPDSKTTQKSLTEVSNFLVSKSCGTLSGFRSDLFEINPVGDTPGYVAGIDYVTGVASKISNLRVQQISAFLTVMSDTPQEIYSDMSLKDLLDSLKIMFNCKWFVDDEGYVRMEHISWFRRTAAVDTTVGQENIRLNKSKKKFKYDRVEIPMREKFNFPYQGYKDFIGVDIKYNSACVNLRKSVSYSVPKFSTDLKYIQDSANNLKDFNSFLLLACDTDNTVLSETGVLTGEDQLNGHLSWANLHDAYYRHDRFLPSGLMNDVETTFETTKKTKRQVPVVFAGSGCCKVINPLVDLVTTELGDGQIDKMVKSNRDENFKIELLY